MTCSGARSTLAQRKPSLSKTIFFGERSGEVTDPFGFTWRLAQFVEDVPHAEIERRMRRVAGET